MNQKVVCRQEMTYNGTKRYKDEVFELQNLRNDYAMVNTGLVHPYQGEENALITDDSGRTFISEAARVNYRRVAPAADHSIRVKRPAGRPKGSKDTQPRRAVKTIAPETASVRI